MHGFNRRVETIFRLSRGFVPKDQLIRPAEEQLHPGVHEPALRTGALPVQGQEPIQVALDAGYLDCYRMTHKEEKGYTFPTWDPHVRLDYAFVPKVFADRILKCEVVTEPEAVMKAASDHLPLLAEVELDK